MKHDLQARQVVAVAHRVGQRPDPVHHGGHEIDPLHPAGLDQAQAFLGVEFDEAGDASAVEQRGVRNDERGVVVERAGVEQGSAERHADRRRPGGIDHGGPVIEDHLWPAGRAAAGHRLPVARHRVVDWFVRHAFGHEIGGQRIRRVPVRLAADHQRRLENVEHGGGLAARQPPGQRRRRRAAFPHRKGGLEKHIAVGQPDGDEIAGLDALGGEGARAAVGVALELLPGQRVIAVADSDGIARLAFGIPARHVSDGNEHGGVSVAGVLMPLLCSDEAGCRLLRHFTNRNCCESRRAGAYGSSSVSQ